MHAKTMLNSFNYIKLSLIRLDLYRSLQYVLMIAIRDLNVVATEPCIGN